MNENKKGLTLMEIIVATVIFALAVAGLMNLFVAGKRYILHSRSRMSGGELGKVFLEPLQMSVRQDTWGQAGNSLTNTPTGGLYCDGVPGHTQLPGCSADRTLDGVPYAAKYEIDAAPTPTGAATPPELRRVVLTVNWSENKP